MTASQRARLCHIAEELCELREECDAADRFELGCIILEMMVPTRRPCDPEPTGAFDECIK